MDGIAWIRSIVPIKIKTIIENIIASFNFLFPYLNDNGIYVVEDLQTSYIPRYGGSRINLNKKNSSMNFIKSLSDSINYEKKFYFT